MDSETITSGLTVSLKIDLPCIPKTLQREQCYCGPIRERVADEKYFRQSIFIYNKKGKYLDSGFIQINDYTDMCKMIRVLPSNKVKLRAFDRWEYYDSDFFKTDKYNVHDLTSGNIIYHCSELPDDIEYGNLEKDEQYVYSQILLDCLEEYSSLNEPEHIRNFKNFREEKNNKDVVCCRLFERLNIQELCINGEITEEEKIQMWNELTCICEIKTPPIELTEEDKKIRAELKLKAQAEIEEVFVNNNFENNKEKID
jgi:hypothetical protein